MSVANCVSQGWHAFAELLSYDKNNFLFISLIHYLCFMLHNYVDAHKF